MQGSQPGLRVISGSTRIAALIGMPARHSLSPTILNAAFAARQLDWCFVVFEVPPEQGAAAVAAMRALDIGGMSVTMPHKDVASATVDERTPVAEALGAVNCVFWDGGRLMGDSTDGPGFVDALRIDHGVEPAGRRCVILGAGGAGRAVAWALGRAGAADVVIVNRSPGPAVRAAQLAGATGRVGTADDISSADLVVNATPLGMGGDNADRLPLDPSRLHDGQVVVDLVYYPTLTPLLSAAAERGAVAVTGVGMLVHQAAHAFCHWTGLDAPIAEMAAAATAELDRRASVP